VDRPVDGGGKIPRKMLRVDPVPNRRGSICLHRLRSRSVENGSIANLSASIIGNVFGFKPLKALRLEDMRLPAPM